MSLKIAGELCVITTTNDVKFEEELTCQFKTDMRNLTNFYSSPRKPHKLTFNGLLLNRVYNVWAKKSIEEFYLMALNTDATFERKLTFHEEFSKFSSEHVRKSKNWDFDGILSSKVKKFMSFKFTGEFCVKTWKNDAKFEEESTCQFEIDVRNLTKFDPSTRKSQKFTL